MVGCALIENPGVFFGLIAMSAPIWLVWIWSRWDKLTREDDE